MLTIHKKGRTSTTLSTSTSTSASTTLNYRNCTHLSLMSIGLLGLQSFDNCRLPALGDTCKHFDHWENVCRWGHVYNGGNWPLRLLVVWIWDSFPKCYLPWWAWWGEEGCRKESQCRSRHRSSSPEFFVSYKNMLSFNFMIFRYSNFVVYNFLLQCIRAPSQVFMECGHSTHSIHH